MMAWGRRDQRRARASFAVRITSDLHDRYVYRDGRVWRSSESFKDMAAKRTTKLIPEAKPGLLIEEFERRWSAAKRLLPA